MTSIKAGVYIATALVSGGKASIPGVQYSTRLLINIKTQLVKIDKRNRQQHRGTKPILEQKNIRR